MNDNNIKCKLGSILIIFILLCSGLIALDSLIPTANAITVWETGSDTDFENGTRNNAQIIQTGKESSLILDNTYQWTEKFPPNIPTPIGRYYHTMARIYGTDKALMFGGWNEYYTNDDTWVYDLSADSWTQKSPSGVIPKSRNIHGMAPIYGTDKVLMFGGWDGFGYLNDTWIYDLSANSWSNVTISSNAPSLRYYHIMTEIYGTDKVILYGGTYSSTYYNETWEYDLSAGKWTNKTTLGINPGGRYALSMAPIHGTRDAIIFGGINFSHRFDDTWIYNLTTNTWTEKTTTNIPKARSSFDLASISGDDKVLMFGGYDGTRYMNDTWVYDLSNNNWYFKSITNKPINRTFSELATIDGTDQVVLFGGKDDRRYFDDTWIYDLSQNDWKQKQSKCPPGDRNTHKMAAVYGTNKVVMYGGSNGTRQYRSTWIYDLNTGNWTQPYPLMKPGIKTSHEMASIYGDDKVILFSGTHNSDETWIYDLSNNNWTNKEPSNEPSMRIYFAMASIYGDDTAVIFGGWDGSKRLDDTWVYDLSSNDWTNKNPSGNKPTARIWHSMASVDGDDKVVLFGGNDDIDNCDDTWIYDLSDNTWTEKTTTSKPSARNYQIMSTIYGTKKVMLYGGYTSAQVDDTWIYDQRENTWTQITLSTKPVARSSHACASIYSTEKVVIFAGFDGTNTHDDTWIFERASYLTTGSFISDALDINTNSTLLTINWNGTTSGVTSIKFQLRSAATEVGLQLKSFVGPDGTTGTYYTTSPGAIWSGHQGDRWIQYKAYFTTSDTKETPSLDDVTISYNFWPDTTLSSPADQSIITHNTPTFTWDFMDYDSTHQIGFQVIVSDDSSFTNVIYDSDEQASTDNQWVFPTGTAYTNISDGTWYWKVRTKDNDGTWGQYSPSYTIIIDVTAPHSEISAPIDDKYYSTVACISGSAHDYTNGTGLTKVELLIHRASDNNYWDGTDWTISETWLLASGITEWSYDCSSVAWTSGIEYNIRTCASDTASNIEQPTTGINFTYDIGIPVSTIQTPVTSSFLKELDNITGTAADIGGADVDLVQISIMRASDNTYWDGVAWKNYECWLNTTGKLAWYYDASTIPWVADLQYTIRSRAADKVGNVEVPSVGVTFMFDDKAPTGLAIVINDGDKYTNAFSITLSLSAEDTGSGLSKMAFSIDGNSWSDWEEINTVKTFDLALPDGEKTVYFKVRDVVGNIAEAVFDTIYLDTTPPEALSIIINDYAVYTGSNIVTLDLDAVDSLSGLANMSFSENGIDWSSWEPYSDSKSITISPKNGQKFIYFRVDDKIGNIAEAVYGTIIFDTKPPEKLSIVINDNAEYTNSKVIDLALNATDQLSGIDQMSFSFDSFTWTEWEQYSNDKSMNIPSEDAEIIIYFRCKDKVGNTAVADQTIILDSTSPYSLSIMIDDGAIETESTNVTLSLGAQDELSGVTEMSFSFDGSSWTDWEIMQSYKKFTIPPGEGTKTIYFRVRDKVGNIAPPASATIDLVEPKKEPEKDPKGEDNNAGMSMMLGLVLIVVIVIILIIVFLLMKKKKKPSQAQPQPGHEQPVLDDGPKPFQPEPGPSPMPSPAPGYDQRARPQTVPEHSRGQEYMRPANIQSSHTEDMYNSPRTGPVPEQPSPVQYNMPITTQQSLLQPRKTDQFEDQWRQE